MSIESSTLFTLVRSDLLSFLFLSAWHCRSFRCKVLIFPALKIIIIHSSVKLIKIILSIIFPLYMVGVLVYIIVKGLHSLQIGENMKKTLFLMVLLLLQSFGGQTSVVSDSFILRDHPLSVADKEGVSIALDLSISPNPFNPSTTIRLLGIEKGHEFSLKIYDPKGQLLEDLTEKIKSNASILTWNAEDLSGGIYIAKLIYGNQTKVHKLLLVK